MLPAHTPLSFFMPGTVLSRCYRPCPALSVLIILKSNLQTLLPDMILRDGLLDNLNGTRFPGMLWISGASQSSKDKCCFS